jgi:GTP cyclohydrolase I
VNLEKIEALIRELLFEIGENPDREGLKKTPQRVAQLWSFLTSGYRTDPEQILNQARFEAHGKDMVIVKNIEFYSLCEHHLLPIIGTCHIGYIPGNHVLGLSKLARLTEMYARRLQIQERLTRQIARAVEKASGAVGVGVVIEARHLCMMMRGVQKQSSITTTSTVLGLFRTDPKTREEFLRLIAQPQR